MSEPDEAIELNLIPLIDVIMFLLIFFISTTSFIEEPGVKVDKPKAASAKDLAKNSIIFARPTVKRLCAKEALPVVIQTDATSRSGMLIRVLDEAKLGGAKDVSLATEKG